MKRVLIVVLIAGIALVAVSAFQFLMRPGKGDPAPLFALPTLSGQELGLDGFQGRPVLLIFWASWCPTCLEELPTLERLQQGMRGAGLVVLSISVDDERGLPGVSALAEAYKLTFPILLDQEGKVADAYQSYAVPDAVLIDAKGQIAWRAAGPIDWDAKETRARLLSLTGGAAGEKP